MIASFLFLRFCLFGSSNLGEELSTDILFTSLLSIPEPLALYRVLQGRKHKKSPIFLNRTLAYVSSTKAVPLQPAQKPGRQRYQVTPKVLLIVCTNECTRVLCNSWTCMHILPLRMRSIEGIVQKLGEHASNNQKNATNSVQSNPSLEKLYIA